MTLCYTLFPQRSFTDTDKVHTALHNTALYKGAQR